jgi:hypothetical protein
MSAYFLVLYIYAGALAKGDSVSLVSIPQPSLQACQAAGSAAKDLVSGSFKELRFVCVKGQQ